MIIFPEPFAGSRLLERRRELKENRAGRIILLVLAAILLTSLGALLLSSRLNGYRVVWPG